MATILFYHKCILVSIHVHVDDNNAERLFNRNLSNCITMRCKGLFGVFILIVGNIILYHGASLYTVDELHTRTSSDPRTSGSYYGRINETKIRSTSAYDHSQKVHRVWPKLPDGRLGNHLFNLACAYGLARINNRQLILEPQYQKHLMHFLNVSHFPFEIANIPDGTARKNFRYAVYEPQKVHLEEKDYVIGNYIQTRQYFQPYESEILDIFTIRDDLIAASQIFLRGLHFPPNSTLVGIHVRRGDVATKLAEEHGRRQPKPIYVENAMAYFLRKYHNVHFIVCR